MIDAVQKWRKLYNGIETEDGTVIKKSLDEAARIVGISKKSLDDYFMQLKKAKDYGFDFYQNRDAKIGVLRNFVKSKQKDHSNSGSMKSSATKSSSKKNKK